MRARFRALAAAPVLSAVVSVANAEPMDPALERLVLDPSCHNDRGRFTPQSPEDQCEPDHAAFKRMISEFGFAFAPSAMHSARTTGIADFHLSLEAQYTNINQDAHHWKHGTQGPVDPASKEASIINNSPQPVLQQYSIKARKGFAFGLEVTGVVGFMPKTSILSGGADVRLALLEGFRTGLLGILPDVAIGGGVRTITGASQFQLTVSSLDAQLSKPLPIQDSSIITPYIGYQYLWIFGDSGLIDLTPGTDAIQYCNYQGEDIPRPGSDDDSDFDGQPICDGGVPNDFNNNTVFSKARLERQRLLAGVNYRYEMVMVGGQFMFDLVDPADAQNSDVDQEILEGEPKQWTLAFEIGGIF